MVGSDFPGTRARRLDQGEKDGECAKCGGQRSSSQENHIRVVRQVRAQRYDGLYRYHRHHLHAATARSSLEFFFLIISSETARLRIWVAHPSLFRFLLIMIAKPGGKHDGNRALPRWLRIFANRVFNWNVIRVRHSGIEASLYAHKSNNRLRDRKTISLYFLLSDDVCFTRLVAG